MYKDNKHTRKILAILPPVGLPFEHFLLSLSMDAGYKVLIVRRMRSCQILLL